MASYLAMTGLKTPYSFFSTNILCCLTTFHRNALRATRVTQKPSGISAFALRIFGLQSLKNSVKLCAPSVNLRVTTRRSEPPNNRIIT